MTPRRVRDIDYQLLPGTDRKTTYIVIERNGIITVPPKKATAPNRLMRWLKVSVCGFTGIWQNGMI